MGSGQVFSVMEGVYSREWYMGKEGRFGEHKRIGRWVWGKNRDRSKKIGGDRRKVESKVESRDKWVQKEWITRKIYGKNFVWMEWQEVWE